MGIAELEMELRSLAAERGFEVRPLSPEEKRKTAEMVLCLVLPTFSDVKPGRLQSLYLKLEKRVNRVLERMPVADPESGVLLASLLDRFRKEAGWAGKGKHVCTVSSFLLAISREGWEQWQEKRRAGLREQEEKACQNPKAGQIFQVF